MYIWLPLQLPVSRMRLEKKKIRLGNYTGLNMALFEEDVGFEL
jgi:hypothetical protein